MILARIFANYLQIVIRPEQNYAVKGRLIQNYLHLVVIEGIEDDIEAGLISLDQSTVFDRVDHWFLMMVLKSTRFELEFYKWISMLYYSPHAVVQVNGKCLEFFSIKQSVWQGCPCSSFYMSSFWRFCSVG